MPVIWFRSVVESKLVLLTTQHDKALGQGIAALFRRPADQEDGGLVSQRARLLGFGC